jgi:hypothetical protein
MLSHELANELLKHPNLPVVLFVNNHYYHSVYDKGSHGKLKIDLLKYYNKEDDIIMGNFGDDEKHYFGSIE